MKPAKPKRIPIRAAKDIAREFGYDTVIVFARRVGEDGVEHMTTYGVNEKHCASAAQQGRVLQRFMGWPDVPDEPPTVYPKGVQCVCGHAGAYHNDFGCGVKVGSASCDDAYCFCNEFRAEAKP
jgi:hypothetical protein